MVRGMVPFPRLLLLPATITVALVLSGQALAGGGNYVFDGGASSERAQVTAALEASAFDWSVVPARITIHLAPGTGSYALPGEIWIDTNLLSADRFAWGTIQHEYGHEVDFFLLNDAVRQRLAPLLGASNWCDETIGLEHSAYGCERFASTLAWAYWPSPDNALRPQSGADESAAMAPASFRALLAQLIGVPDTLEGVRAPAGRRAAHRPGAGGPGGERTPPPRVGASAVCAVIRAPAQMIGSGEERGALCGM